MLPGEWDYTPECTPLYGMSGCEDSPLWLPEEQEPHFPMPGPGMREDGKLWFEGAGKAKASPADDHVDHKAQVRARPPLDALRSRDVRRGDKWLPWHFERREGTP